MCVLVVEAHDKEDALVGLVERLLQFLADGRKLEVKEIAVRGAQVVEERFHGDAVVCGLGRISVDEEVDHGEEGVAIDALFGADLAHCLVAKAQSYAKGAESLQHAVVVADEVDHLVVGLV